VLETVATELSEVAHVTSVVNISNVLSAYMPIAM
jgi:hypothetical protein